MLTEGNPAGAVVTGNNNVTNLGVVRSLGRHGVPVTLLGRDRKSMVRYSRYVTRRLACPAPEQSEDQFIDILTTLGKKASEKQVLIPTSDAEILPLSKHRVQLEKYYLLPVPPLEIVQMLVNKRLFYQFLAKLSVPYPKTYFPADASEIRLAGKEIEYPYIVKPAFMHLFMAEFGAKCFVIRSCQDLDEVERRLERSGLDVMIQEIIPGVDLYSLSAYFNRQSEPLAICGYEKIRQRPPDFGIGTLWKSAWRSEPIDLAVRTLKAIGYYGLAEPEFKRDPRDGQYKFLEINARSVMPNALPAKCGVDMTFTAYCDMIGGRTGNGHVNPQDGILWLHEIDDAICCLEQLFRGTLKPADILRSLNGEKVYAIGAWDDPLPLVAALFNFAGSRVKQRLEKVTGGSTRARDARIAKSNLVTTRRERC